MSAHFVFRAQKSMQRCERSLNTPSLMLDMCAMQVRLRKLLFFSSASFSPLEGEPLSHSVSSVDISSTRFKVAFKKMFSGLSEARSRPNGQLR